MSSTPFPYGTGWRSRYRVTDDGCWEWMGAVSSGGYGRLGGKHAAGVLAHRVVYTDLVGPIPEGLTLDHLCRNRICVNPAHLEPVTIGENLRRGNTFQGINARKTHCSQGHPFDEANTILRSTGGRRCRACSGRSARKAVA